MHHNAARRLEGRPGLVGWRSPGEIMGLVHRLEFEKGPGDGRKPVLCMCVCVRFVMHAAKLGPMQQRG